MGEERWQRYLASFAAPIPVSIRINPFKKTDLSHLPLDKKVAWCDDGFYLSERPNFTLDPLLHAGAYYVQEASSMFLSQVMRRWATPELFAMSPLALDLCAAPGGKSTLMRAQLPEGVVLFSNEPDRRRANILMENMQKQGHPDVYVTNAYPRDYARTALRFSFILADVPCSGEGMFRKDEGAIGEWGIANVMKCAQLQRTIIEDIWPSLMPGGMMVYSTCTFNTHENEENVRWIKERFGAEVLQVPVDDEWNITGSLLKGFAEPCYRFIPGTTHGEGLFTAVLRKPMESNGGTQRKGIGIANVRQMDKAVEGVRVISNGRYKGTQKGKSLIPAHAEALLVKPDKNKYPSADLTKEEALRYLHHEAIILPPDVEKGFVVVRYHGLPLGFVKNLGCRANNLYPQEWKIRNTFTPTLG